MRIRLVLAAILAASALVTTVPAYACGVGVVDAPQENPATLRLQAARFDANAATEEATAKTFDLQATSMFTRARQLETLALQRGEPERSALVAQALSLEDQAQQLTARAQMARSRAMQMRRQALVLRQRAAQIAAGGGGWRRGQALPPTA
jgi:hypothetical protein